MLVIFHWHLLFLSALLGALLLVAIANFACSCMDYLKQYRRFVTSHYLTEGLRITFGIVVPAIVFSYFDQLFTGIVISLGAMCVTITDTPGPIHHRRNGMFICTIWITLTVLIMSFATMNYSTTAITLSVLCFLNCMIGIFGGRANSIGVASLVIMVLSLGQNLSGSGVAWNAFYILCGGLWYTLLSLVLYGIRPYKLAQQALGEMILEIAAYLRVRAGFYDAKPDYETVNKAVQEQQVIVERSQAQVNDLLFRSRKLVKESTPMGRSLVAIYMDTVDLFEKTITSFRDYRLLHEDFDDTDILKRCQFVIYKISGELDEIGIAVQANRIYSSDGSLINVIDDLKKEFMLLRDAKRNETNIEAFISLRQIVESLEDMVNRLSTLHIYTAIDRDKNRVQVAEFDTGALVVKEQEQVSWKLFADNLTLQSNVFRHALRVTIATLAGFIISRYLTIGHSYWILLTIIVILKPNYSLTKKRNYDRLIGTVLGALLGLGILYVVKNERWLFVFLIIALVGTYSFVRSNYKVGVVFMTTYVLLLFYLIYKGDVDTILVDRLADTGIGSGIAFLANLLIVPAWEKERIKEYMLKAVESNIRFFKLVSSSYEGIAVNSFQYKLVRKEVFVAVANMVDAFNRMVEEPKFIQEYTQQIHQFVVLNNLLTSNIVALMQYAPVFKPHPETPSFKPINLTIDSFLNGTLKRLEAKEHPELQQGNSGTDALNIYLMDLLKNRRQEIKSGNHDTENRQKLAHLKPVMDQYNMILATVKDLYKISGSIVKPV